MPGDNGALGVLGGMGPLASAEFVRTLYRLQAGGQEQRLPRVLLDSDPAFPDRTEVILRGDRAKFAEYLQIRLRELIDAGASRVVIACFTAHHFLPLIDPALRARVVSLVDTALEQLGRSRGRYLLLSTVGTRQARIFQDSELWAGVANRVVLPGDEDQDLLHRLVYRMKRRGACPDVVTEVDAMRTRYRCRGLILGCTEFHLVSEDLAALTPVIDALWTVANDAHHLLLPTLTTHA